MQLDSNLLVQFGSSLDLYSWIKNHKMSEIHLQGVNLNYYHKTRPSFLVIELFAKKSNGYEVHGLVFPFKKLRCGVINVKYSSKTKKDLKK